MGISLRRKRLSDLIKALNAANGAASIDFLDADGKTIQRIPASNR